MAVAVLIVLQSLLIEVILIVVDSALASRLILAQWVRAEMILAVIVQAIVAGLVVAQVHRVAIND